MNVGLLVCSIHVQLHVQLASAGYMCNGMLVNWPIVSYSLKLHLLQVHVHCMFHLAVFSMEGWW